MLSVSPWLQCAFVIGHHRDLTLALCDQVQVHFLASSLPMKAAKDYCLSTKSSTRGSFMRTFIKVSDKRSQQDISSISYSCKSLNTEQNSQELCLPLKVPSKGTEVLVVLGSKSTLAHAKYFVMLVAWT